MWTHCSLQNRNASTLVLRTYVIEMLKATAKKLKNFISSLFAIIILIPFFHLHTFMLENADRWNHVHIIMIAVRLFKSGIFSRLVFDWCFTGRAIQLIWFGSVRWAKALKWPPWVKAKESNEQLQTLYDFCKLNENAFGTNYIVIHKYDACTSKASFML